MPLSDATLAAQRTALLAKTVDDMEWMEAILRGPLGNNARFKEWCAQAHAIRGWSRATFKRRLRVFKKRRPDLTGGRWVGDPYSLLTQSAGAMTMVERMTSLSAGLTSGRLAFLQREVLGERESFVGPQSHPAGSAGLSSGDDLIAQATAHTRLRPNQNEGG
jgi:hypothetical protein